VRCFHALVQHAVDVVAVLNAEGTVRYVGPAIERVFGYRPEELVGVGGVTLVHPDDADRVGRTYAAVARHGGWGAPIQFRTRYRDGSWREAEAIANNLLGDPAVGAIIVTLRDITARGTSGVARHSRPLATNSALHGLRWTRHG